MNNIEHLLIDLMDKKLAKVRKYMAYAEECGSLAASRHASKETE